MLTLQVDWNQLAQIEELQDYFTKFIFISGSNEIGDRTSLIEVLEFHEALICRIKM